MTAPAAVNATVLGVLVALAAGCALPQHRPAVPSPLPAPVVGRTYASACGPCHDHGGFAVRVLADRLGPGPALIHQGTKVPPEAIRAVVRHGLGAMPAMSRAEVTDAELEGIVAYLGRSPVNTLRDSP